MFDTSFRRIVVDKQINFASFWKHGRYRCNIFGVLHSKKIEQLPRAIDTKGRVAPVDWKPHTFSPTVRTLWF